MLRLLKFPEPAADRSVFCDIDGILGRERASLCTHNRVPIALDYVNCRPDELKEVPTSRNFFLRLERFSASPASKMPLLYKIGCRPARYWKTGSSKKTGGKKKKK